VSKYDPLYKWLKASRGPKIGLSFKKIEQILGFDLPRTSRKDSAWWANEKSRESRHIQCRAWLDAGFHTENVNIPKETVDFVLGL
jgi:hypothetical protein